MQKPRVSNKGVPHQNSVIMRTSIMDYAKTRVEISNKDVMKVLGTNEAVARSHILALIKDGCLQKSKNSTGTKCTTYVTTGKEYRPPVHVNAPPTEIIPHARVIRLLDKKPDPEAAKFYRQERRAAVTRGSSMAMFDSI